MNRHQKTALSIAAASLALILLFPPIDQFSIASFKIPVFAGFYFYFAQPPYAVVNANMLLLEIFVVLINAGISWLLLQSKPAAEPPRRRIGYQKASLLFAGANLIVILLFPPFESVFALTNAALPSFEGFYFVFGHRPNHTIVTTLLYIEVFFVLINAALAWLIFKPRSATELAAEQAYELALQAHRRKG